MKLKFKKIFSQSEFEVAVDFLKSDVKKNGGSASEVVSVHEDLRLVEVSSAPWGQIVINKPITEFEAWQWWTKPVE